MKQNFAMSYSGGKDSALALHTLIKSGYTPKVLFTVNQQYTQGKNWHALSKDVLNRVADSLKLPIEYLDLDVTDIYQDVYPSFISNLKDKYNFEYCAFGDIYLENMKKIREDMCTQVGLKALLPIFGCEEENVLNALIDDGFKCLIKSVDTSRVCPCLLGREMNRELVEEMKKHDFSLCGEKGEYHTFVYDGPIFNKAVDFEIGDIISADRYLTLELI